MSRLTTQAVAKMLVEAGALTEDQVNQTSRIVIDLPANGLPQVFVQMDAPDTRFWSALTPELAPMLKAMVSDDEH